MLNFNIRYIGSIFKPREIIEFFNSIGTDRKLAYQMLRTENLFQTAHRLPPLFYPFDKRILCRTKTWVIYTSAIPLMKAL